jgi:SPP1 family phage portal protein
MATDLERAVEELKNKKTACDKLWAYYDGKQPLVYSTERLAKLFKDLKARFSQNWCAVVIDSELDRLTLKQLAVADDDAMTETLSALFEKSELLLDADDVHKAGLVIGEAFVIAWPDAENQVEAYYNDPRMCHVFYEEENPRQKSFAAKWWIDREKKVNLTLYYPDRLEYYQTAREYKEGKDILASAFQESEPNAVNPHGEVPVFHFKPDRRIIKSELQNVLEPQDGINKLLSDMMIAAEYGAFKQKWIISNADTKSLKNAPNEVWTIPGSAGEEQAAQVGEFSATELGNYLNGINNWANFIATASRTPKHYLFDTGGQPSGEALIALEAPLNKKAQQHSERFAVTWRKLAAFMLKLQGQDVDSKAIQVIYERPQTVQPRTQAEIRQINSNAGIPLTTILREEGKSPKEIEDIKAEKEEERTANQLSFASALLDKERDLTGGNGARETVPAER